MSSRRFLPAGLLLEHGGLRVMIDGGAVTRPEGKLDAWLLTDDRAELAPELRRHLRGAGVSPKVARLRAPGVSIEPRQVVHTSHPTFGYRIMVAQGTVVWAPEFLRFPRWAKGAALMFAEAAAWDRPIWFAGKVGGHAPVLEVAEAAKRLQIERLVFAHLGRPTLRAIDRGEAPPSGEFGRDGARYVLDRRGRVKP
ncbi:MAG: hypothetical protein HYZ28_23890 [Myxococcales bacterium]|nr:hypothetical protein [Myxococcales bacterium]